MPFFINTRVRRWPALGTVLAGALCLTASVGASAASAKAIDTSIVTTTSSGISVMETPDTKQTCTAPNLVSAFASLGDTRDYVLAPGGSFEGKDLDGWQVQRAKVGGDGSPLELPDSDKNKHSLTIPAGGSATTPAMCVDLHYPTFRLMTKPQKGQGQLKVEIIYPDSDNPVFQPVGEIDPQGKDWTASADVPVFPERGGAAPGMRRVALRFTSVAAGGDAGEWSIDDVYIDPRRL